MSTAPNTDHSPEAIVFPELSIIDPHVHMWDKSGFDYYADELLSDIHNGHKIEKTIYVECHMGYDHDQPEMFQPVGETRYVLDQITGAKTNGHDLAAGILGCANLMLGPEVRPVLEAHIAAAKGRFRGLRAHVAFHTDPKIGYPDLPRYPKTNVLRTEAFAEGARCLRDLGLTLDIWALHTQLEDIAGLAIKIPDLPIVINHCGGPIGVGPYAERQEETFVEWTELLRQISHIPNLHIKLSGLGMARLGWRGNPAANSDELVTKWKPYIRASVEAFGPTRSIFASNFPVDRAAGSYRIVVNAYKKILADLPREDIKGIFCGNAQRVYQL